jgi:hypothetical protein
MMEECVTSNVCDIELLGFTEPVVIDGNDPGGDGNAVDCIGVLAATLAQL